VRERDIDDLRAERTRFGDSVFDDGAHSHFDAVAEIFSRNADAHSSQVFFLPNLRIECAGIFQ
jgi:hypothetical protein